MNKAPSQLLENNIICIMIKHEERTSVAPGGVETAHLNSGVGCELNASLVIFNYLMKVLPIAACVIDLARQCQVFEVPDKVSDAFG